jgi:hypothetical protein
MPIYSTLQRMRKMFEEWQRRPRRAHVPARVGCESSAYLQQSFVLKATAGRDRLRQRPLQPRQRQGRHRGRQRTARRRRRTPGMADKPAKADSPPPRPPRRRPKSPSRMEQPADRSGTRQPRLPFFGHRPPGPSNPALETSQIDPTPAPKWAACGPWKTVSGTGWNGTGRLRGWTRLASSPRRNGQIRAKADFDLPAHPGERGGTRHDVIAYLTAGWRKVGPAARSSTRDARPRTSWTPPTACCTTRRAHHARSLANC